MHWQTIVYNSQTPLSDYCIHLPDNFLLHKSWTATYPLMAFQILLKSRHSLINFDKHLIHCSKLFFLTRLKLRDSYLYQIKCQMAIIMRKILRKILPQKCLPRKSSRKSKEGMSPTLKVCIFGIINTIRTQYFYL